MRKEHDYISLMILKFTYSIEMGWGFTWAPPAPLYYNTSNSSIQIYKQKKASNRQPPHPCLLAVSSMYTWCQSKQDSTLAPSVQTWTPSLNLRLQPLKERIGCREDGCPSYEVFEKEPQSHILVTVLVVCLINDQVWKSHTNGIGMLSLLLLWCICFWTALTAATLAALAALLAAATALFTLSSTFATS